MSFLQLLLLVIDYMSWIAVKIVFTAMYLLDRNRKSIYHRFAQGGNLLLFSWMEGIHAAEKQLLGDDVDAETIPTILDRYGNTESAGSIIVFHLYNDDFKKGDLGVICSFGAGYSVGSLVLRKR